MGQKTHPIGFRLGIIRTWDSRWYQEKQYKDWLHEDVAIRTMLRKKLKHAGLSRIEIERADKINVIINTSKPGIVIGSKGKGIEEVRKDLLHLTNKDVKVTVHEIKRPELDARLVAENIVEQLEKRIAFRRAMKQAARRSIDKGAKGIKIQCSGRLAGAEIARRERTFDGKVPLHTLRADIDFAIAEAYTTYGRIGVKVWLYRGEVWPGGKEPGAREDLI
ncbi:MAG TPA: 30S ribosomal protein S3 [Candidatus Xenobia bacterium]